MKHRTKLIICIGVALILLMSVIAVADEILLSQIEADYAEYRGTEEASIRYCYGVYNGCVPVVFQQMLLFGFWEEEVAGFTFYHTSAYGDAESGIRVWRNGEFMSLQEAYSQGFLSKEDIEAIWEKYNAQ